MTYEGALSAEAWAFVDEMLDERISDDNLRRLEAALDGNPLAQRQFFDYCQLHVNLHADVRAQRVVEAFRNRHQSLLLSDCSATASSSGTLHVVPPAPVAILSRIGSGLQGLCTSRYLTATLAVLLLALAVDHFRTRSSGGSRSIALSGAPREGSSPAVAFLAVANGCAWGASASSSHSLGSGVRQGEEIALQEGIAEFRLASGVYLSVEGPAALVVTSPSSFVLQYGKLTANVPWTVSDFRAVASMCRITACDAEFGISLGDGKTEIDVFSGEVLTESASRLDSQYDVDVLEKGTPPASSLPIVDKAFLTESVITQGKALILTAEDGGMKVSQEGAADETRFATRLPMAWPLPITQMYIDAVLASLPVAYWRFESNDNGIFKSDVHGGTDLKVVGKVRLSGSANRVVDFGQSGSGSYLVSHDLFDVLAHTNYSIEVWVKPSHLHCGGVLSLLQEQPERHGAYLELQGARGGKGGRSPFADAYPGRVRFLHRDPPGRNAARGSSCFSVEPYRLRRWQHIVAVKDDTEMRLYVDGKLTARTNEGSSLSSGLRLIVGQQASNILSVPFFGQLDELAMYPHALTDAEVAEHYQAVDWSGVNSQEKSNEKLISFQRNATQPEKLLTIDRSL